MQSNASAFEIIHRRTSKQKNAKFDAWRNSKSDNDKATYHTAVRQFKRAVVEAKRQFWISGLQAGIPNGRERSGAIFYAI